MKQQPELPLANPDQPQVIECSNYDYPAKLAELRSLGVHIEQIKVLDGGYRLTVEWPTGYRKLREHSRALRA